jgi:ATP-dependent Clp protease protease subunit
MRNNEEDFSIENLNVQMPASNVILLFGGIEDKQAAEIVSWVFVNNMLEVPPSELIVVINSPGGNVHSAFAIIEAFRGSSIPVRTIGMGQICSAGLLIFMAGAKGRRVLTPTCSIMSHQFSTAIDGTYHDLLNARKELDFMQIRMLDMYTSSTGKSESYVKKHLLNPHDSWLSPEEAIKHKKFNVFFN